MAEIIAGALISGLIQELVERLASPGITNFLRKNRSIFEKLQVTLWSANSLLNDVEDKQVKDVNVKNWVDKLNEVLNESDNVLDSINTEALRHEIGGKALLKKLLQHPFNVIEIKQKLEEINKINERLELLLCQKDRLGLKEGVQSKMLTRSIAPLIDDASAVYGRDRDKEAILDLLFLENIGGQDKISVIPIVGMGGIGKSTLARFVYDDSRVKNHFEHRVWVTVSVDFDVLRIAKLVLEGLSGKACEVKELGKLREELEKFLGEKKFFLVLDDVWNENYDGWNTLMSYFQVGADGSKIILTTRNEEIGSKMGSVPSHFLTPMKDDDCWELFQKHAFGSVEASKKHDVEQIGIEIVKHCKGLPLAVLSLAGLLRSVSDPKEWEKVRNSDVWEIQSKGDDGILPSLWLSYSYLPSNLKRCFACCSIFPKEYEFPKEKIISLWMAEGLVGGENMEDVGEEYLKSLVSRSLLQRSAKDESEFLMHNLVHDLATFVSGKDICITLLLNRGIKTCSKPLHACFDFHLDSAWQLPDSFSKLKQLRTLILNSQSGWDVEGRSGDLVCKIITKFKFMRMLDLHNSGIKTLPSSIAELKHLRFLDLSRNVNLKELPESITSLCNLQTLKLNNCSNLRALPRDISKLVNLRNLENESCYSLTHMPRGLGQLSNLRTLSEFVLPKSTNNKRTGNLNELMNLNALNARLKIKNLRCPDRNKTKDALLQEKEHLRSLVLICDIEASTHHEQSLEDLRPHQNLLELCLSSYGGGQLPSWLPSLPCLVKLQLLKCPKCQWLPRLDKLLKLRVLVVDELTDLSFISEEEADEVTGDTSAVFFPVLEELQLTNLPKLEKWWNDADNDNRAFPRLSKLTVENCPLLTSMPLFPTLEEIKLTNTPLEPLERTISWSPATSSSTTSVSKLTTLHMANMSRCDPAMFQSLHSLQSLTLDHLPDIDTDFLKKLGSVNTLRDLHIWRCDSLEQVSGWIGEMVCLTTLSLRLCPNLIIPSEQISLITCLSRVEIDNCPLASHVESMIRDRLYTRKLGIFSLYIYEFSYIIFPADI